ncbi:hypothetical protein BOTBODRAFT_54038 [Botryobasidium botryosum FD-172 SS1]|uniref:Phospholipid scramblase n=1 Tax=Botryobasidium botryosum (strain FD-172 SS1) TaxID=930990 RepID=A0A067MWD8_BOTB1|nr:hypothetical protein BOTBODRAFT_54038 [Botryobasidium botryosum FD-172 SS1]
MLRPARPLHYSCRILAKPLGLTGAYSPSRLRVAAGPNQRSFAWSRFPDASQGPRLSRRQAASPRNPSGSRPRIILEPVPDSGDPEVGLQRLLENDALVVVRQIEMLNIFIGFEQANRYAILDQNGNNVGFIAEEDQGFFGTFARQLFRTHRAFRSVIMDQNGNRVLWINRPFSWINSRLFVQRIPLESYEATGEEEQKVVLGEGQQEWHPWRRKYHLFKSQGYQKFDQFASINGGFWAWDFFLQDAGDNNIASIRRNFAGFGREIFTDTGQYVIRFTPDPDAPSDADPSKPIVQRKLSLEERALVLAMSVGIDFDYFSRHSEGGGGMGLHWLWWFSED